MNMVIGGLVGGLIGAAVWAGVVYTTEYEIGWIAIGVGFLVGLGVRIGDNEKGNDLIAGIISVVIAIGAIALAKFLAVYLMVNSALNAEEFKVTDNNMIAVYANNIAVEKEAAGEKLIWPPARNVEDAPVETTFPKDIWLLATEKWSQLSAEEKEAGKKKQLGEINQFVDELRTNLYASAFKESFGGIDILFFLIAAYTAFNVGSGKED